MDDHENMWEIKKLAANVEEKIDYWLMAAEAAAIAFAVQQTHDSKIGLPMLPLALAVALWGYAFYAGYRRQRFLSESLTANYDFIQSHSLGNPCTDDLKQTQTLRKEANRWGARQFPCFMIGAIFYLAWHIIEMAFRG